MTMDLDDSNADISGGSDYISNSYRKMLKPLVYEDHLINHQSRACIAANNTMTIFQEYATRSGINYLMPATDGTNEKLKDKFIWKDECYILNEDSSYPPDDGGVRTSPLLNSLQNESDNTPSLRNYIKGIEDQNNYAYHCSNEFEDARSREPVSKSTNDSGVRDTIDHSETIRYWQTSTGKEDEEEEENCAAHKNESSSDNNKSEEL